MSLPTKPQRIQRKRTKGFRLHDHSIALNGLPVVYVGRGSKWGSPFIVGRRVILVVDETYQKCKDAGSVIVTNRLATELYRTWLDHEMRRQIRLHLARKNLACWCSEDAEFCHADVLLEIANS